MATNEVTTARNRLAGLYAFGRTPTPEVEAAARRALTVAKIARSIREGLAASPAITPEQRAELATLLIRGGELG